METKTMTAFDPKNDPYWFTMRCESCGHVFLSSGFIGTTGDGFNEPREQTPEPRAATCPECDSEQIDVTECKESP